MQDTPQMQASQMPMPVRRLRTNRSLLRFILFSIITFGIYSIVFFCGISNDINTMASRHDGKKTMFYLLTILLGAITLGIVPLVWFHRMSDRVGSELLRRGVPQSFGAADFWLWYVLGSFIIVGPFIYLHRLATAMNSLAANYNVSG